MNGLSAELVNKRDNNIEKEWQQALAEFENGYRSKHHGKNFPVGKINNVKEAMQFADNQKASMNFQRHDEGRVDRVRSAFSRNIDLIGRVVTGAEQLAYAAGAFPPAMPLAPIMTAFSCVLRSFKDVSADYDRVIGFFVDMHSFLNT